LVIEVISNKVFAFGHCSYIK